MKYIYATNLDLTCLSWSEYENLKILIDKEFEKVLLSGDGWVPSMEQCAYDSNGDVFVKTKDKTTAVWLQEAVFPKIIFLERHILFKKRRSGFVYKDIHEFFTNLTNTSNLPLNTYKKYVEHELSEKLRIVDPEVITHKNGNSVVIFIWLNRKEQKIFKEYQCEVNVFSHGSVKFDEVE
uniref:Uncharacterized protein n=1 Tax=viral metagenome TaxID=1070528 RepID=A0A6C0J9C0_9ZZZZ